MGSVALAEQAAKDQLAAAGIKRAEVRVLSQEEIIYYYQFPPLCQIPFPGNCSIVIGEIPEPLIVPKYGEDGKPTGEMIQVAPTTVIAYWFVLLTVHVEPMWISPEHRGRAGLIRRLWKTVRNLLKESNVQVSFAIMDDGEVTGQVSESLEAATRLGFERAPGHLYFVRTDNPRGKRY